MNLSQITTSPKERKKMRHNLRLWMRAATDEERRQGLAWYSEAMSYAAELADTFGVSGEIAAGVISALSPNNRWERNKKDAFSVLLAVERGMSPDDVKVCTFSRNKAKAFAIAQGDQKILKESPKTYAFARNVGEMDANHVTIDKWHLRACQSASKKPLKLQESCTAKQYRIIEEETLKVAEEHGMTGYAFQAIVWVTIRNHWAN
jgi:hypothetical protein